MKREMDLKDMVQKYELLSKATQQVETSVDKSII